MAQFKDLFTELRRDTGLSQEDFVIMLKGYKKNGTEKYLKCILKTSRHHSQI